MRRASSSPTCDEIGVVARVAPEDKIRLVRLLKRKGNVVAMTGDGVNDAPALKAADIGVAMGITGTEVSKEAAVMILTDDNFATIVNAVSYGRTLYDNLVKYLRFQMSTLVAYIAIFLGAGIFGIAGGVPLNPLQILWLNMVVDIPIAIALGFDQPTKGLMSRPRAPSGPRSCPAQLDPDLRPGRRDDRRFAGGLPDRPRPGRRRRRGDHAAHHAVAVPRRRPPCSAATRPTPSSTGPPIPGVTQLRRYGISLLAIVLVTAIDLLERIVGTTAPERSPSGASASASRRPWWSSRSPQARPARRSTRAPAVPAPGPAHLVAA